jgi:hypothetical protein
MGLQRQSAVPVCLIHLKKSTIIGLQSIEWAKPKKESATKNKEEQIKNSFKSQS